MENGMFLHVGPPTIRLLPVELLLTPNRRPLVFRPKLTQSELDSLLRSLKSLIGQQYDTVRVYSFVARLALSSYFGARFPLAAPRLKQLQGSAAHDLVYDNSGVLPLASGVWTERGDGTTPSAQAEQIAQAARTRTGRIATIGGRNEENVDGAEFMRSSSSSAADEPPQSNEAVICTDAILPRLLSASAEWRAALGVGPSGSLHASASGLSRGAAALRKKLDYFHLRSWSINDVFSFSALRPDLLARIRLPPVNMPEEFADLSDNEEDPSKKADSSATTLPFFETKFWRTVDAHLAKHHPTLHSRSAHAEALLNQVYVTANPLFRSMVQLYSYTMRRLPLQLQTAIRLYLLLVILRQVLHMWRGFVLVRQGVRVVRGVLRPRPRTAKASFLARWRSASRSKSRSRSPSPSSTLHTATKKILADPRAKLVANLVAEQLRTELRTATKDAQSESSPDRSSSRSPSHSRSRSRSVDKLERMLSHPRTAKVATMLVDQLMPAVTLTNQRHSASQLLKEVIAEVTGAEREERRERTKDKDTGESSSAVSPSHSKRAALRHLLSTLLASSSASTAQSASSLSTSAPVAPVSPAPIVGRKRAALKSAAQTTASIAFPRLSRLLHFTRQELAQTQSLAQQSGATTTASTSHSPSAAITEPRTAVAASPSSSVLPPSSPSRSLSPASSRAIRFAADHPHLASAFEQGKLLLLSAVVTQFADRIRSAL
jgi:hypothetical protein